MTKLTLIVAVFAAACLPKPAPDAAPNGQQPEPEPPPRSTPAPPVQSPVSHASSPTLEGGDRPRYDFAGKRLAYVAGPDGARKIHVRTIATGETKAFGETGDDLDPTWTPDGRIVFSSNRDGDYDLWLLSPNTGAVEQISNLDGDELQPSVAPVEFGFYAVRNGMCGGSPHGRSLDQYYKVLFTRRVGETSEIWFSSMQPLEARFEGHEHGRHSGRISAADQKCSDATFSGDGLSVVWSCDGAVHDAPAKYEQTFSAALASVKGAPPKECKGRRVDLDKCLPKLQRKYASYTGTAVSSAADALSNPSISTNQTILLADAGGKPMFRSRFVKDAKWQPFPIDGHASDLVWSPKGVEVAFANSTGVARASTDFYMQRVHNLHRFGELFDSGESKLLQTNRFVVRPAEHKEFYVLHDKLRYAGHPQFISADVALQVFRDEFLRLLERGEAKAAKSLHGLTGALMLHFAQRIADGGPADRYFAVLFGTAWAPLEAAASMEQVDEGDLLEMQYSPEDADPEVKERVERLNRPVAARLPGELKDVWHRVPKAIRSEVKANVKRMLRHSGVARIQVPGAEAVKVDFSQFKIRGAYAENELGAYFLAMNWLGSIPLPLDASLLSFATALESVNVGDKTALKAWKRIDALIGSFMGRPVDATLQHVVDELRGKKTVDTAALATRLLELRGDVPIRDADGGDRKLSVTVFPKRIGLDVTFFRALTHPKVDGRGMPSAVDVFATLGNATARDHAIADAGKMAAGYRRALHSLTKKTLRKGLASTDLYHSWLAALVAMADPLDIPSETVLEFATNDAWKSRQLYSALAGYTQLKHSAVLYAMQDIGVECDGRTSYYVAIEQPVLPQPPGFVEPNVAFYEALAGLAKRTYASLHDDPAGPNVEQWADEDEPKLNAMNFAKDLAEIARVELSGTPLNEEQLGWIEYVGGKLEPLTVGMVPGNASFNSGGEGRQQRGVALVTDIHTNGQRQQALQIGIGRIFDLWVVVPAAVGQRLTQGGVLSFYEFTSPTSRRLTDADWGKRLDRGKLPARPGWTRSFIEAR